MASPVAPTTTSTWAYNGTGSGNWTDWASNGTAPLNYTIPHTNSTNSTAGGGNSTYPAGSSSGCSATAPSQLLENPSFECSGTGWNLDEVDIVWGSASESLTSARRIRDILSPDSAYDGKGFARFEPTFEDVTATLSQTLAAPATSGSYWYSFAYRVPSSGVTPDECTLTVSNDEGTLATLGSLSAASTWTMTGKEFQVTSSASTFSLVFSCSGVQTASPILDIDNIRMGMGGGNWTAVNGTSGGHSNSTGLPTWSAPSNITYSPPPTNLTRPDEAGSPIDYSGGAAAAPTQTTSSTEPVTTSTVLAPAAPTLADFEIPAPPPSSSSAVPTTSSPTAPAAATGASGPPDVSDPTTSADPVVASTTAPAAVEEPSTTTATYPSSTVFSSRNRVKRHRYHRN
ncbi:hypothetical protein FOPE_01830 [Fonsecaea pedrosoi]|nr:hypothetical protein FOPE_01830 [Fonsecaea pedrosoi]